MTKTLDWIVSAAEEKKAKEIKSIEIKSPSKEVQKLVIMSGESSPQLKALTREIESKLKENGIKNISWEGDPKSGWMILDTGEIVVHIMTPKERKYYNLEELWGKEGIVYHF